MCSLYTSGGNLGALLRSAASTPTCLLVLINHALWALHSCCFPPWQLCSPVAKSLHSAVLHVPCLSLFFGVSAIPAQRSDTGLEHVNCSFPGAILPKTCWQWSKFSLLPITKADFLSLHFSLLIFEQFHGTANSVSWHFQMKQMQHLNTDFPSQKCHPVKDEIPQA